MFRPAWPGQICSLGYQLVPQIEEDLGLELTGEQVARLVELYRLDPATGRRVVRRAGLRRPKGAGKSPEGGFVAYAELVLPVRFERWSKRGQPVGAPLTPANGPPTGPWVQLAAVSEDQTDNVMVWLYETLAEREDTRRARGIDLGRSRLYLQSRPGRIEPVTAAAGSREGQPVTLAVLDQTESWFPYNGGRRLAHVLRRNASKTGGWTYELQNAPEPGDGSVADETARASEKKTSGVLYDAREAPEVKNLADRVALRDALAVAYGEAALRVEDGKSKGWVDLDRLVDEIQDPDTDPGDARRYYLNQAAPSTDWAFDRKRWAELGDGRVPADGETIVVGFDGARFDDATALVGCHVETGHVWLAGLWESDGTPDWEVPEREVTATVEELFDRWQVWRLYADPPYWDATIDSWAGRFTGHDRRPAVIPWWTNRYRQVGFACRALANAVRAGEVRHDGDTELARHVGNAVRRRVNSRDEEGRPLWSLGKPSPSRKIDAAMALVLAWEARGDCLAAGAQQPAKPGRRGWAF